MLNCNLSQKLKLIGRDKVNHIINTFSTFPRVWAKTSFFNS
jgi:hypothetical protein